jgi:signal transduction histidine kinase
MISLLPFLFQTQNPPQRFFDLFFSFSNPILFSILFIIIFIIVLFLIRRFVFAPLKEEHYKERKELELKNARLMALFAELDPDPVLRIDKDGKIIDSNKAAETLADENEINGRYINDILSNYNFDTSELIIKSESATFNQEIGEKYFTVNVRGIQSLNIVQIYLHDVTERTEYEERLKSNQKRLKELSRHIESSAEEERNRIAEELHDSVGQNLSFLKLKVQEIFGNVNGGVKDEDYNELLNSVDGITSEIREISYRLKPKILSELGIAPAIKSLVEMINHKTSVKGTVSIIGDLRRFDYSIEINIYRFTQEAINNILKHSKATEFDIQLVFGRSNFKIVISDNGLGFDAEKAMQFENRGLGLFNMRERMENINGVMKIESEKDQGTIIIGKINYGTEND